MNAYIKTTGLALMAMSMLFSACQKEEVYDDSVTRSLEMTLDGEPWNIYYGTSNLPLFIYKSNGDYYANYSTSFRFSLPNSDTYRVLATNQADYLTPPTNLDEEVIPQDPESKKTFAISTPIEYHAGDDMKLELTTRTGMLRLHATDVKADKSYQFVRTIVSTPVTGYSVAKGEAVTGDPIDLTRVKESSGGVGFTEDMYLIGSENDKFDITLEYLDADSLIINTKKFDGQFNVLPNQITEIEFELNNPNEDVILSYDVTIGFLNWRDQNVYPSVKVEVPDGYTYVEPGADLSGTITSQLEDESVEAVKIFLKASSNYVIADKILEGITKPFEILGQTPGFGQEKASVSIMNISMEGDIDEIRFENLNLSPQRDRIFNLRNQEFHVGTIAMVNCDINSWSGTIYTSSINADDKQVIDNVLMDNCRLTLISTSSNPLWNPNSKKVAPIYNWTFKNSVFHGRNWGSKTAILGGLENMGGKISVTIDGCVFLDTRGTAFTYFNLDGAKAESLDVKVTNSVVGGAKTDFGTWFNMGKTTSVNATGNLRSKGYQMTSYGIDTPAESDLTYDDYLNRYNIK